MTAPRLFDPKTTSPPKCRSCGTTKKNLCRHDGDIAHGYIQPSAKRPKTCLNAPPEYDPSTAEIPF